MSTYGWRRFLACLPRLWLVEHLHQSSFALHQSSKGNSSLFIAKQIIQAFQLDVLVIPSVVVALTQASDPLVQKRGIALKFIEFTEIGFILLRSHHRLLGGASNSAGGWRSWEEWSGWSWRRHWLCVCMNIPQ